MLESKASVPSNPDDSIYGAGTLVAWWRAGDLMFSDAGTTPCVDGDLVQQWWSKTNGYKAIQTTSGARPRYSSSLGVNSTSTAIFDGGDYMTCATGTAYARSNTVFFVCIRTNTDNSALFILDSTNGASRCALYCNAAGGIDNNYNIFSFAGSSSYAVSSDRWSTNHWEWMEWVLDQGADCHVYSRYWNKTYALNGAPGITDVEFNGPVIGGRNDGAANWCGKIIELMVFNGVFTPANRTTVSNYFNTRYGL